MAFAFGDEKMAMPLPRMTRLVKMKTVDVFSLRSARRNTPDSALSPDCPFKESCNHFKQFQQSLQSVQTQDSPVYNEFIGGRRITLDDED